MDKKNIAIIVAAIVILLSLYQFVYVPLQNEEAMKNYNEGLQNVSAINKEMNQSFAKADRVSSSNVSGGVEATAQTFKEVQPMIERQIEKLNETRAYANGNQTKEKYIDYQIQAKQVEKALITDMIREYNEFADAYNNTDVNKMLNVSNEMQNTINSRSDEMIPIRDNIINLLNENPDFNQTLHQLNLSSDLYGDMDLNHVAT